MRLLAVETATEACSAALWIEGEVRERYRLAPREHTALILSMVDELLAEAQLRPAGLDVLAFGRGPGSFTGVRIATAVIQGIALGLDRPVAPVSTLAALAQGRYREGGERRILATIDARMGEVYWGAFEMVEGVATLRGEELVCPPELVPLPDGEGWYGVGSGWASYGERLRQRLGTKLAGVEPDRFPHAADVASLGVEIYRRGGAVSAEKALPVYLRDNVAERKGA